ncbi:MAG TPA: serine hydrolase domain-containing protein [Steroidobacteraceae bacterium]|jgi:CubicO group peptidase (beta-lactamase class C family)|nr:serine hydrolase domain-containing protein [Steroidobacteraceae bacterium]
MRLPRIFRRVILASIGFAFATQFSGGATRAAAPIAADNPRASPLDRDVDRALQPLFANHCHVGLSIAVVDRERTAFYDYGSVARDESRLPTPDSIYEIGSVTKSFTGALAAEAVVRHLMALDTDFRQYLPEPYPNLAWRGRPITLRTLATHRSGLPRDLPDTDDLYAHPDFETLPFQLIARDAPYDHARYLRELRHVQLLSAPGSQELYSNLGVKVIGFGLEKVTGTSFEALMRRNLLRPLAMTSTGFVVDARDESRLVVGFSRGGRRMPYRLRNAGAAYGLYSTARDMAKYLRWQLNETNPVVRLSHQPLLGDTTDGKGLIWNLGADAGGRRMLWHGGGTFGMTSQVVLYPDDREGFALLANDTCKGTESALKDIAATLHGELALATDSTPERGRPPAWPRSKSLILLAPGILTFPRKRPVQAGAVLPAASSVQSDSM